MDVLKAALVQGLLRTCALLPLRTARGIGRALAAISWRLDGRARRVTQDNLLLAFPELSAIERERLARRSLAATGELIAEMGHVWLRPWDGLRAHLEIRGEDRVRSALRDGRGVLVLVPHLGNWEVVGLHLASLGPTVSLYRPPRLAAMNTVMLRARQRTGAALVPADRAGVGALLRSLRAGGIAGILPDQVPPDGAAGCNAPFMGVPCFTGALANRLLRRSGALAVTAHARRVEGGFILHYREANEEIAAEELPRALAALNREVESCLRDCPEQYQWEYKRFRTRGARSGDAHGEQDTL
jgi:KDO2-lipid IV(A) lauroyltransferase